MDKELGWVFGGGGGGGCVRYRRSKGIIGLTCRSLAVEPKRSSLDGAGQRAKSPRVHTYARPSVDAPD